MQYRYAAGVEYQGGAFHGWQRQQHSYSVQEALEQALSQVAANAITVVASGRTDTGVHAVQQVVHFDSPVQRAEHAWRMGGNRYLPDAASLPWVQQVESGFHARYSALSRRYRYLILNRPSRSALWAGRALWQRVELDAELMHQAAQALLGEHDFSAFRAAGCQAKHAVREMLAIDVWREGDLVLLELQANAFLYNMVRILVGTLIRVGTGEVDVDEPARALKAQDRCHRGVTVGAHGLYFLEACYPACFALPTLPVQHSPWGSK